MSARALWIGFLAIMTINPDPMATAANRRKKALSMEFPSREMSALRPLAGISLPQRLMPA
jgi:hypothetical protein